MIHFIRSNLMRRLVFLFLGAVLTPIIILSCFVFYHAKASLNAAASDKLSVVTEIRKSQVLNYFKERLEDVRVLAESEDVRQVLKQLNNYSELTKENENKMIFHESFSVNSELYANICKSVDPFFKKYMEGYGYNNIFLMCKKEGYVVYAAKRNREVGTSLKTGPYKNSVLAKLWENVIKEEKLLAEDFAVYEPTGETVIFIAAPVFDEKGGLSAVIALQISADQVKEIMKRRKGMGETGRTFLVGEDFLVRSYSVSETPLTVMKDKIATPAVHKALNGQAGTELIQHDSGLRFLSSYSRVGLKELEGISFDWAIVSEIDEAEAVAPIRTLGFHILWAGLALMIFGCGIGYLSARSIANPLKKLSDRVRRLALGDLTVSGFRQERADEVGVLMNAFQDMLQILRDQTRRVMESTNSLSAAASQISVTAAQLAASSSETSTSVAEISTTVEEVRQTARVSNEKANNVAERAKQASQISELGRKSTEDAISGMKRIKEEMAYVAESIVKLSEQTQSIGEIISAVNDLADQSNLLSVNASIEAAKAGEHGKGFAVVAQEVKSLADQSKEATSQVKSILSDIQKATSAAVMATERGSKAVESGVYLSSQLGDSVGILSRSVMDSAQAAVQIAASSQEQLIGMDQLAQAMENIKEASFQNVDGARQLERATKDLEELGRKLKEVSDKFKV
jgi:methyl-accepting chemotaxis protein